MARVSIFLVTVALIAGMVGCGQPGYNLTISSTAGGSVTTPGEGTSTYDEGTVVNLVATPGAGYRFVKWTGDVGTIADVNDATTTITMNGDYSITANFVALYDLTTSSTEGGNVTTPGVGTFTYDEGEVVDLVAEADACYEFINWTGDVDTIADVYAASTNITMDAAKNVTANFAVLSYNLTADSTDGGSVADPGEGTFTYDCGDVVNLVATPGAGYRFDEWTGDVGTVADVNAAATNITMSGNYSITAEFVKQYDLTISSTEGGSVTTPGEGTFTYDAGTVVNLVAVADECYEFVNWTGDTVADPNSVTTTITMGAAKSVTANFALLSYSLTVNSTAGGSVTDPDEGTFTHDCGTVVNLMAVPDTGYHFVEWTGDVGTIADVNAASTNITMNGDYSITANFGVNSIPMVAAGRYHTVGLKSDGTVVAVGWNSGGQCNVGNWTDITRVAAGCLHTVGVKSDGTVVAVGWNYYGQCDVGGWTDITGVAAGWYHTVGLKSDGTVVAVGYNSDGQCNVSSWTGIIQIAASDFHTVGVKDDGTVVAVGWNDYGQCNVGGWTDITRVAARCYHTVGLKSDGTVVAVGRNNWGQCDVGNWTGITRVAAGYQHTVGVKADGAVVAVGHNYFGQCNVGGWTGIVQVTAGRYHTVGLKSDGTVVAVGYNGYGQCNVGGWTLN